MKTSLLRRISAAVSALAIIATFHVAPALAAGLTNPTAAIDGTDVAAIRIVTLTLPAATNLTDTAGKVKVVVRTMAGAVVDLSGHQITAATNNAEAMVLDNAGDLNGVILLTDGGAAGFAATPIALTFPANTFTANTSYQFSVFTDLNGDGDYSDGDFGSTVLVIGTSNNVVVSAQVEPTLTLNLANTSVDLGVLTPAAITSSATDPTATVATNAQNGWTLQVKDADLDLDTNAGLYSTTASKTIAATPVAGGGATAAGSEGFDIEVSETANPQGTGSVAAGFAATTGTSTITTANQTIASGTGPNAGYIATVNIRAAISAITPAAADYTTSLTFSATGGF
jgi:hypothetical protein